MLILAIVIIEPIMLISEIGIGIACIINIIITKILFFIFTFSILNVSKTRDFNLFFFYYAPKRLR